MVSIPKIESMFVRCW